MHIPCGHIREALIGGLQKKVQLLNQAGKKPKLLTILLGDAPDQLSYVNIKRKLAEQIGVDFEFLNVSKDTSFTDFKKIIEDKSSVPDVTGVIIQQPLPKDFDIHEIYSLIPPEKEIEGQLNDGLYTFPLVQACMLGLSWAHTYETMHREPDLTQYTLPIQPDPGLLSWLNKKNITIAGKGVTTGQKIAQYFTKRDIPFHQTDSRTQNPEDMYARSDIIISGVGKHIIYKKDLRRGVILLNFGLRKELDAEGISRLRGDYNELEVRDVAQLYTKTPNGLGPIDVLCLYGNLLQATGVET